MEVTSGFPEGNLRKEKQVSRQQLRNSGIKRREEKRPGFELMM